MVFYIKGKRLVVNTPAVVLATDDATSGFDDVDSVVAVEVLVTVALVDGFCGEVLPADLCAKIKMYQYS